MSGHSSWKGVTPMTDPHQREVQMGYVDGYALAIDDMFKELNQIEQRRVWNPESRALFRQIRQALHNMRGGAQQTMKMLTKGGTHEQGVPAEAGLGEGLRGDLGGLPGQPPLQDTAPE